MPVTTLTCVDVIGELETFETVMVEFWPFVELRVRLRETEEIGSHSGLVKWQAGVISCPKVYVTTPKNLPNWFKATLGRHDGLVGIIKQDEWVGREVLLVVDENNPVAEGRWLWYAITDSQNMANGYETVELTEIEVDGIMGDSTRRIRVAAHQAANFPVPPESTAPELTYQPLSGKALQESDYGNY